jgi:hypothetical protein
VGNPSLILQRLEQHFQHLPLELGQLVHEKDAVVGEADFAGRGMEPPPMRPASETEWWGERKGRVVTRAATAGEGFLFGDKNTTFGRMICELPRVFHD